jgi:hypothetical protein
MTGTDKASGSTEKIDLLRGGAIVSSLTGAFGGSLKETRITALLGYLIALNPAPYLALFRFPGVAGSVTLENRHETGRSDILVETTEGRCIVEAKVDATDAVDQAKKYGAFKTALLSSHRASPQQKNRKNVVYVHWEELVDLLRNDSRSSHAGIRFVSGDLIQYLEEFNMIREKNPVEIYAREINELTTLALFLHARMYGCWYQAGSELPKAHYFAPHFGKAIAGSHPGISVGISYIAKVRKIEVVDDWNSFINATISASGRNWYNTHKSKIDSLKDHPEWDWTSGRKRTFIYMDEPRLVFNPAVKKEKFQKSNGNLSKFYFSFDDLFKAWGC